MAIKLTRNQLEALEFIRRETKRNGMPVLEIIVPPSGLAHGAVMKSLYAHGLVEKAGEVVDAWGKWRFLEFRNLVAMTPLGEEVLEAEKKRQKEAQSDVG